MSGIFTLSVRDRLIQDMGDWCKSMLAVDRAGSVSAHPVIGGNFFDLVPPGVEDQNGVHLFQRERDPANGKRTGFRDPKYLALQHS